MAALYRVIDRLAGNVRELRHVMERAVLLAPPAPQVPPPAAADAEHLRTLEALDACHGNQTRAARRLGIARSTLLKRLDLYNVPRPRKP